MRKITKLGADAVQEAAMGHNSKNDDLLKQYVEKIGKKMDAIDGIRGNIKEMLNDAKTDGFLKTSIRSAIRNLRMTEEQKQSKNEIDVETVRITQLCADLPLFHRSAIGAAA